MTTEYELFENQVIWIIDNWKIIPDKFKIYLKPDHYRGNIPDLSLEEHIVILLLDRQKPSVIQSYDFDEERIGITREGKVIWGFDSGCSCPSPWIDAYPNCYNLSKSWKEFIINLKDFDKEVIEECLRKVKEIKQEIEKTEEKN
jgi:hypothetical protein